MKYMCFYPSFAAMFSLTFFWRTKRNACFHWPLFLSMICYCPALQSWCSSNDLFILRDRSLDHAVQKSVIVNTFTRFHWKQLESESVWKSQSSVSFQFNWYDAYHLPPTKLLEGNVFSRVCLYTGGVLHKGTLPYRDPHPPHGEP